MEQKRVALESKEIENEINRLKREGKYDADVCTLVESDFKYGLNKEEVNVYLSTKFDIEQMKLLSKAIKEHGLKVARAIAEYSVDYFCMSEAVDYYAKGVPFEKLVETMQETNNAFGLKSGLDDYLFLKEVEEETAKKDAASLEAEITRLTKELSVAQEKVAKGEESISKLRNDLDVKNKELEKVNKTLEALQKPADEAPPETEEKPPEPSLEKEEPDNKEEEVSVMKEENKRPAIPVHYAVAFPYGTNVIEKEARKSSGMAALVSKLGFKKKSYQDVVRLAINGRLKADQLTQLKTAITFGLTEKQMQDLINSNLPAAEMKEIIEIAVLVNEL